MSDTTVLQVTARDTVGKGAARAIRRSGLIPAVIYGEKEPSISITLERSLLIKHLNAGGFFNTLFDVEVNGKTSRVLPREVQLHPVTDSPQHVDFLRVSGATQITVEIPVEFVNEDICPGLRMGGVLNVVRYNVEVSCTPDLIPNSILLDLANAEIGDSLHISAVDLPTGVSPTITDRDFTIATIAAPTIVQEETTEDDEDLEDIEETTEEEGIGEETEE